jgi:hypothetical protein
MRCEQAVNSRCWPKVILVEEGMKVSIEKSPILIDKKPRGKFR